MRFLVEGVGSPMWATQFAFLKKVANKIVSIDINPKSYGLYLANSGYLVPKYSDKNCFEKIKNIIEKEKIEAVLPVIHEGLPLWSKKKGFFKKKGVTVCISEFETILICHDKWETYKFFKKNNIPTPKTSLKHEFDLIKPRVGRGGKGIERIDPTEKKLELKNYISQEYINGQEYSVDALCDREGKPICIVPRKRLTVESGLSVIGETIEDINIIRLAENIIESGKFFGPINMQCFKNENGIYFTEINPRLAGGTSLSMHATKNWFEIIVDLIENKNIPKIEFKKNVIMMRHYTDTIVKRRDLKSD